MTSDQYQNQSAN